LDAPLAGRPVSELIVGLGIDLIEVARFEREVTRHGDGVISELFTPPEIAACRRFRDPFPAYAIRFAAKEALLKALGTGLVGRMSWRDIEILDEANGERLRLTGETGSVAARLGVRHIHLSTAQAGEHAAASVVLEGAIMSANG
jgi:holo-[acyl-carrier protein] synthase